MSDCPALIRRGFFVRGRMGGMKPEMSEAIRDGAAKVSRHKVTLNDYLFGLRATGEWTDKELREIEIAISFIVKPLRPLAGYAPSDN